MDIKAIFNIKEVTSTIMIIIATVFISTFYLTYIYLNKDSNEDNINYNNLAYSIIPSVLITSIVLYYYGNFKSSNCDLLKDDFYS